MTLYQRASRRADRIVRDINDIRVCRTLRLQPRRSRTLAPVQDILETAALIVVAHPDDEIIGAGALLSRLSRSGIICVTDGSPRRGGYAKAAGFDNWLDYAATRRKEAENALKLSERFPNPMLNLGIADQEAVFNLVAITRFLAHKFDEGFDCIVTHAYEGGHPDHDAAAFCVHAACALIEANGTVPPAIVEMPLYNAPNGKFVHNEFLSHGDAGPVHSSKLSLAEQELKQRQFDCHATQSDAFSVFDLKQEKYRIAPRYHFSAPPHDGKIGFDHFGWPLTGKIWRRTVRRAMSELGLLEKLA